ncbi:MAG: type VI secretion system contractile sheath domain-containing protein [Phycisphaerae bacterium]
MASRSSSSRFGFEFTNLPAGRAARPRAEEDAPFRIAVLGDFGGRASTDRAGKTDPPKSVVPITVDVDTLDKLPGRLGTHVHVPIGGPDGPRIAIRFASLDEFHPDSLYERLDVFLVLKALRKGLNDPATFAEAAHEVRSWARLAADAARDSTVVVKEESPAKEAAAAALERLLDQPIVARITSAVSGRVAAVQDFIRDLVKPYIVPAPDAELPDLVAHVDRATSGLMRSILHDRGFQALEAAWRGLAFLTSQVETDETLEVALIDISKEELAADLAAGQGSALYRRLVEETVHTPGGRPWALAVGCYAFDATADDGGLLGAIGSVAQAAGAPFIAQANSHVAGCESFAATPDPRDWRWQATAAAADVWHRLAAAPQAASVGLVAPRFMLRLPYGRDTEAIDSFDFEELADGPADAPSASSHEDYLWGNGAFVCAALLAAAFRQGGWDLGECLAREISGLPMHVAGEGDAQRVTPPAEAFLTDRAMQALLDKGLIPLLSIKGRDAVRVVQFQSIASPAEPLAGRWR